MQCRGLAVHSDVRDMPSGAHHARAQLEGLRNADRLDDHVRTEPVGEVGDQLFGGLAGIRHSVGTEPLGSVEPGGGQVHGDDPLRREQLGRGDRRQSDGAYPTTATVSPGRTHPLSTPTSYAVGKMSASSTASLLSTAPGSG